jgi:DNA-binding XRE family transcriptional regulator
MIPDYLENLPDPALDQNLKPCHSCGAKYNIPGIRRGPTILMFSKNAYRVDCLAEKCKHRGKMERTCENAIISWNKQVKPGKLRELRKQRGLSQVALGDLAGIGYTAISKIEMGKQVPTEYMLTKLSKALGVDISEI